MKLWFERQDVTTRAFLVASVAVVVGTGNLCFIVLLIGLDRFLEANFR